MSSNGFLYAIGAALVWGIVYAIDQKILHGISPFVLVFLESLITAAMLLPLLFFKRDFFASLSGTSSGTWALIIVSIVLATLANFFIFSGIKILGASTASVFEIAYPFFVVLFAYLFSRQNRIFIFY